MLARGWRGSGAALEKSASWLEDEHNISLAICVGLVSCEEGIMKGKGTFIVDVISMHINTISK